MGGVGGAVHLPLVLSACWGQFALSAKRLRSKQLHPSLSSESCVGGGGLGRQHCPVQLFERGYCCSGILGLFFENSFQCLECFLWNSFIDSQSSSFWMALVFGRIL